jgi:hypothetical protein
MYIKDFFARMLRDWVALMSGGASIIAGFLAAYFQVVANSPKTLLWLVSGICLVITTYRVWANEHRALLDEQAKNSRPKISGTIRKVKVSYHTISVPHDPRSVIAMDVDFFNERPVPTTLKHFELEITCNDKTYIADELYLGTITGDYRGETRGAVYNLGNSLNAEALEFGHHKAGWLQFNLDGVKAEDIDGCSKVLIITDGFDIKHRIVYVSSVI